MDKFDCLSFSTSWNWRNAWNKGYTGKDILNQIINLGFNKVELNYKVTKEMLKTMYPVIESGQMEVSSVHNVFPYIEDQQMDTDSIFFAYDDEVLRSRAIDCTINTIDYAHQLGAGAVVMHIAATPIEHMKYDKQLKNLYQQGTRFSQEYQDIFKEMIFQREKNMSENLDSIIHCLDILLNHIAKRNYNIILGIENRAICHQIPTYREAKSIIDHFDSEHIGFWLDIGHSVMMENIGLNNREDLDQLKGNTVGVHIHDVIGVNDHYAPYCMSNCIDDFITIIKDARFKVLELGIKNSEEAIKQGTKILYDKIVN